MCILENATLLSFLLCREQRGTLRVCYVPLLFGPDASVEIEHFNELKNRSHLVNKVMHLCEVVCWTLDAGLKPVVCVGDGEMES